MSSSNMIFNQEVRVLNRMDEIIRERYEALFTAQGSHPAATFILPLYGLKMTNSEARKALDYAAFTGMDLQQIDGVDLSGNCLDDAPLQLIKDLFPGITKLYFDGNSLRTLFSPQRLGSFIGLERLSIKDNMFPRFPSLVSHLPNLKYLDFSNRYSAYKCNLLPAEFLNSDTMTDLHLAGNSISEMPRLQMPKLETLNLGNNKLRKDQNLWNNLAGLPSLEVLDLTLNGLTELPAAMPALPKLRRLILNDNAIGSVAAKLGELYPSLERVEARASNPDVFKRVLDDNVVVDCG